MTVWQNFTNVRVGPIPEPLVKPRLSLTSDILSFRRCQRQYGYFGNDGFVPAQATQIFYGTIIHQVLDRCHRHFAGLMGVPRGTMPTDNDIDSYFEDVLVALRSHGIRPASNAARDRAKELLKLFNAIEGPALYPRVRDTECRLESDRSDYIVRGVVDVLATSPDAPEEPSQMELWDYKGTRYPGNTAERLQDYIWQMCVYAELYRVRSGVYPARAILYFLNELLTVPSPTVRPRQALYVVNFNAGMIEAALAAFDLSAHEIIECRSEDRWPLPGQQPDKETCDICDIRWNCPVPPAGTYPPRDPFP